MKETPFKHHFPLANHTRVLPDNKQNRKYVHRHAWRFGVVDTKLSTLVRDVKRQSQSQFSKVPEQNLPHVLLSLLRRCGQQNKRTFSRSVYGHSPVILNSTTTMSNVFISRNASLLGFVKINLAPSVPRSPASRFWTSQGGFFEPADVVESQRVQNPKRCTHQLVRRLETRRGRIFS